MRSAASASVSSQYGFCSRVNFDATVSSWTWTRASSGPCGTAWRISLSVINCIVEGNSHRSPCVGQTKTAQDRVRAASADYGLAIPMTPQATRPPASPVGCDFRSSAFSCTITPRPMIDFSPLIIIILSVSSR